MIRTMLVVLSLIVLAIVPDSAQAQFYKGKTITMIVNYPAGGPTDLEGRIVALHLPAHIPGNPTIVVKNVGGAGGLIGSNQLGEFRAERRNRSASSPWTCPDSWSALRRCARPIPISS